MRIVVTSEGAGLEASASPTFGRCPVYVFVDTETEAFEAVENPASSTPSGAGIRAAQFVIEQGAQAVVTGNVGPNAFEVLRTAGVPLFFFEGGTVQEAVEAYREGRLSVVGGATAPGHAGLGRGADRHAAGLPRGSRAEEIAALQQMAGELREQLAGLLDRLDRLEKGE